MEAILSALKRDKIKNVKSCVVISNKPNALGLRIAFEQFKIPTKVVVSDDSIKTRWDNDKEIISVLRQYDVTPESGLVCLAGFMRIISPEFVRLYRNRIMNIHPALLPSFPGLHAQRQAIEYGVKITGCTVHFVDVGIDSGPIILQKAVCVSPSDTEETLSSRILKQEHKLYPESINLFTRAKIKVKGRKVFIQS
jgi:phosphoribosylglycinamide formyltransferase-1